MKSVSISVLTVSLALIGFRGSCCSATSKNPDFQEEYMADEVDGYGLSGGSLFDFGDRQVDFFAQGLKTLEAVPKLGQFRKAHPIPWYYWDHK